MRIKSYICNLLKIVKTKKLIGKINKDFLGIYNDEPAFFSYLVEVKDKSFRKFGNTSRRYIATSKERCLIKMLGEIIERYCVSCENKKELIWGSYDTFKNKAINPKKFIFFNFNKISPFFPTYKNEKQKLYWTECIDLVTKEKRLIPAQCIYLIHQFRKNEPRITFPVSTGTAFHFDFKKALTSAILEVVERDAFMTHYLTKLPGTVIEISQKEKFLYKIVKKIERYNLKLILIDISTEFPVWTILGIIIDESGIGPAISVGAKSHFNLKEAITCAIEECIQSRIWIRTAMVILKNVKEDYLLYGKKEKLNRGLFWSKKEMIKKISFFWNNEKISIDKLKKQKKANNLNSLIKWIKENNIEFYFKDVTPHEFKNKFYTIKVVSPSLQPLYFDERFPQWNLERLKMFLQKIKKVKGKKIIINKIPHPFL
jgi:ribosomal protein S12 methylthiotransferase accessory factor